MTFDPNALQRVRFKQWSQEIRDALDITRPLNDTPAHHLALSARTLNQATSKGDETAWLPAEIAQAELERRAAARDYQPRHEEPA